MLSASFAAMLSITTPPECPIASVCSRSAMVTSPSHCGLGLRRLQFRGHLSFTYATAWRLAAILAIALAVGFRIPVSPLRSCYLNYGAPTLTSGGTKTPIERASLRYTHNDGCFRF